VCETCCNIRGDFNNDGLGPNISDLTQLVGYLFNGGPEPTCLVEGNVDGFTNPEGGIINVSDLTYLIAYLFRGGPAPADCP